VVVVVTAKHFVQTQIVKATTTRDVALVVQHVKVVVVEVVLPKVDPPLTVKMVTHVTHVVPKVGALVIKNVVTRATILVVVQDVM
jgi:hypothetical protein